MTIQNPKQRQMSLSRPFVVRGSFPNGNVVSPTRFRDPEIAQRVADLLQWAGVDVTMDDLSNLVGAVQEDGVHRQA